MKEKTVSFKDENGNSIEYVILEQKLINKNEYVVMAPIAHRNEVEVFKIKFDKDWNESLQEVESEKELNMVRQVSTVNF